MKKITKKLNAILLIIILLLNYVPIIVTAATTETRGTFALESEASKYDIGDEVQVVVKPSELVGTGAVRQFTADIEYDNTVLELKDIVVENTEYGNNSKVDKGVILVTKPSGDGIINVGDVVCTLKFQALKSSETSTTVRLTNLDVATNLGDGLFFDDGNVNEPEITLPVEPQAIAHNLKITKTDDESNAITNNSALFKVQTLEGKSVYVETTEDGTVTIENMKMPTSEGPFEYIIEEVLAPIGYVKNENPAQITVTFNEEGVVTNVTTTNAEAQIIEETNTIDIKISNKTEEVKPEQEQFNLVLNKVDEENQSITTGTAQFTISLPDGTKVECQTSETTGKTQNIELLAPEQAGTYTYLIKETQAPEGYELEENTLIAELTFENQENKIVLVSAKIISYGNEEILPVVQDEVKTLTLNIKNKQEVTIYNYTLNIDKVKMDKTNIIGKEAIFEVTKGEETVYVKTNEEGKAVFNFFITNKELEETNQYIYTIKEVKAPEGYEIDKEEKTLTLTINEQGEIQEAVVEGQNIEKTAQTSNEVNILVANDEETVEYNYTINIDKVKNDTFKTPIREDKAIFEITKDENVSYVKTNELGKASINLAVTNKELKETKEYTYQIKEIKAPEGYELDETLKTITVTFNEDGTIKETNISGENIEKLSNTTNTVNVRIANEEKEVIEPLVPEDFNVVINKVDEEGNIITTSPATFALTRPDGNNKTYQTQNGVINNIELVEAQEAGRQVYFLKETQAPEGYEILENTVLIEMNYIENEQKVIIQNAVIKGDTEETVEPVLVDGEKTIIINIKNNKKEQIPEKFNISIDAVDEEGNKIENGNIVIKLTDKTTNESIYKEVPVQNGKIELEMPLEEGQKEYEIEQIKAPEGYEINKDKITIEIEFGKDENDKMELKDYTVEGATKPETTEKNTASITITNNKIKDPLTTENFNVVINKVDEEGNIITNDEAIFKITSPDGTQKSYTTQNGVINNVELLEAKEAGKQIYFMQETKSPEGYEILSESVVIEMNYIESDGKIVLNSTTIKGYDNETVTPITTDGVKTLVLNIKNIKKQEVEERKTFNISLNGVDRDGNPIQNGTTVVKVTDKITNEYIYKEVTINNGKIELEMPVVEATKEYEIEQIKAPEGYETNKNKIAVQIEFAKDENNELELKNYTVEGTDAQKGTTTEKNTASVIIINDKIVSEPEKQNYSLEINKIDAETKELITQGQATFTVITADAKSQDYTSNNGQVVINELVPLGAGKEIIYVIKEKVAPEGYETLEKSVVIKVAFEEKDGKIVVSDAGVLLSEDIATVQMQENTIEINIENKKKQEDDDDLYVISKKYTNGEDIYDLFKSYKGEHYSINSPFVDTKEPKLGNNVKVNEFLNNLESNGILTVWDLQGNQLQNGDRVKTNMILKATKGKQELTFTIVVKGDSDGDGRVRTKDLNMLVRHLSREEVVTSQIALRALDMASGAGDGRIRTTDLNKFYKVLAQEN